MLLYPLEGIPYIQINVLQTVQSYSEPCLKAHFFPSDLRIMKIRSDISANRKYTSFGFSIK